LNKALGKISYAIQLSVNGKSARLCFFPGLLKRRQLDFGLLGRTLRTCFVCAFWTFTAAVSEPGSKTHIECEYAHESQLKTDAETRAMRFMMRALQSAARSAHLDAAANP
jgi:hypothetical protein